jgi:hypothetical protein
MSWDEIDQWASEQRKRIAPSLSRSGECAETGKTISADRMRTQQAAMRIQRGFHPFGLRLREPRNETCGTCDHLRQKETGARLTFYKCSLRGDTNGPGTDCRKKWPACEKWEVRP